MAWLRQWDIVIGIPILDENGCGQLSCGEPDYNSFYIGEALIPCAWMLLIVHAQNVDNHSVDNLCLAICLGMESCGLGELGIQH